MSLEVRTLTELDLPDWIGALHTGFLRSPAVSKEEIESRRALMAAAGGAFDSDRAQGAFDAGRCVATFRSFVQRLTVPGGTAVAANAISNVTVSPTHRRRGLLSRMMDTDARAAKERGDVVSTLIAAEYPIYGRYGFGPATWATEWEVDTARAGLDPRYAGPSDGGRVDLAGPAEVREHGPGLHERLRAARHGVIDRTERWWLRNTGALAVDDRPWQEPFYALYRSPEGEVDGLLAYTAEDHWEAKVPRGVVQVQELTAVSPAAERALWYFLLSTDLVARVRTGLRAPDDVLPLLLPDPRAARTVTHADYLWVRPLDVPALLTARTYTTPGSLVLDVTDRAGLANGRFLLEAGPDGATCVPTARGAELTLDVAELGTLALGDEAASRLAVLGRVSEERAGALAVADGLLRTARRPWCPDVF
ncbi:GNAT family N-acetyltransferase [Streptomyces albireticuli]|uniref:GNAT family N-acetyltransferase n=1 Tax=Streptomyces albireticuli TaxID=1940 RepID=UPI0036D05709